jgi:hypothetical protein
MNDRDTFAAAALTGLLASNPYDQAMTYAEYADESYRMADAMLRERERVTDPLPKEKRAEVSAAPVSRPPETRTSGVAHSQAWSCDLHRYVTANEEQRMANHDAAPAATARTDSASCGRGCGGTDKPVTLPAMGSGDTTLDGAWATENGGRTVPLYRSPTLTDEEREAVAHAASRLAGIHYAATLRKLLERLA